MKRRNKALAIMVSGTSLVTLAIASGASPASADSLCPANNVCLYIGYNANSPTSGNYTGLTASTPNLSSIGWSDKALSGYTQSPHAVILYTGANYTGLESCISENSGPIGVNAPPGYHINSVYITAEADCHQP